MTSEWIPEAKPWRVAWIHQCNQPGMNGWSSRTEVFDTEEAAIEAINRPFGRGVLSAELDWIRNGRWLRLGTRKRKQQFTRTRKSPEPYV